MAGTQRRGDVPKPRRHRVEYRQPFRAEHVSLGEGLRAAFAHENRGPSPAQAAAIRAEVDFHERRREEQQRRLETEQERRRALVLQDRLAREQRAQAELAAKQQLREEQGRSNILGRNRSASPARRTTQVPLPVNQTQGRYNSPSFSRAAEVQVIHGSGAAKEREWHVMEPGVVAGGAVTPSLSFGPSPTELYLMQQEAAGRVAMPGQGQSAPPPAVQRTWAPPSASPTPRSPLPPLVPSSDPPPGASVLMVPQESHDAEERLFASRPSFTPKRASVPPQQPERQSSPQQQPPPPQPPVRRSQETKTPPAEVSPSPGPLAPASQSSPVSQRAQLFTAPAPASPSPLAQQTPQPAGIGISFVPDQDGNLLIAHLVPGGPAMTSGQLFVGDRLLSVSGLPVAGKSVPEVIRMILGPKGTEVTTEGDGEGSEARESRVGQGGTGFRVMGDGFRLEEGGGSLDMQSKRCREAVVTYIYIMYVYRLLYVMCVVYVYI